MKYLNQMEQIMFWDYVMSISEVPDLYGNFETYLIISNHDMTAIGLSETRLNDNGNDLPGLCCNKIIGHHKVDGAGGGLAVCVSDHVYLKEKKPSLILMNFMKQSSLK